jgi:hypothetical protein
MTERLYYSFASGGTGHPWQACCFEGSAAPGFARPSSTPFRQQPRLEVVVKLKTFVLVIVAALFDGPVGLINSIEARSLHCTDYGDVIYPGTRLYPCDSMTSHNGRLLLKYQDDNNLVLYDTSTTPHTPMWSSGPADNNPGYAILQQPTDVDTNFYIIIGGGGAWFVSEPPAYQTGDLALVAQDDGNLVLYRNGSPVWDTATWF